MYKTPLTLIDKVNAVERWWAALPETRRRAWYRPAELVAALPLGFSDLPHVLALAGWSRVPRRTDLGPRVLYVPPGGAPVPVFLVGRNAWVARLSGLPPGYAIYSDERGR